MDHDDEVSDALNLLKEYLRSLPDNYKIKWYSSSFDADNPTAKATKWMNIHCQEIEDLLEIRWVWTIMGPNEKATAEMDCTDVNPFDLVTRYDLEEVWSQNHINKLLTEWVQTVSETKLGMEWDPIPKVDEKLQALEEKLRNEEFYNIGQDATGKEIFVSSETMDFLLEQDPDEAATIIKHMKQMLQKSMEELGDIGEFNIELEIEDEDEDEDTY